MDVPLAHMFELFARIFDDHYHSTHPSLSPHRSYEWRIFLHELLENFLALLYITDLAAHHQVQIQYEKAIDSIHRCFQTQQHGSYYARPTSWRW